MYIVKIVGALKGIEDNMEVEILDALERSLRDTFENYGLFEILVKSSEEVPHV